MDTRIAIGLALLLSSASCTPPPQTVRTQPASSLVAPRATAVQLAAVPAGPVPLLLAAPPAGPAVDAAPIAQAPPFVAAAIDGADAARALDCLTAAVYYEARSEAVDGQRAVAQVVLNRVRNPAFPASICGVVYQGSGRPTGCQFTFTCDGALLGRRDPAAWDRARAVAADALAGDVYAPVGAATYYHTTAVSPWWAPSLTRVAAIGAHIFYRLHDAWSGALDFRQSYAGAEPQPGTDRRTDAQATDAIRFALAGGGAVLVHHDATAPADTDAGVTVHRGEPMRIAAADEDSGVRVHVGSPGPSADQAAPGDGASGGGVAIR